MGKRVDVPFWIADDGKKFKTQQEMQAYEGALVYGDHVDEYLENLDFGRMLPRAVTAQKTRIRAAILSYLAWANAGEPEKSAAA